MEPYEIIGAPFTLWVADTGTAFPLIDAAPGAGWTKVGTNGDRNYSEEGVTVAHPQSLNYVRPAGATGPVKAFRTEEDLRISLTLWDITLEQYAFAMNRNAVTTTAAGAGTAGFKKLGTYRGTQVNEMALLLRGISAYDAAMIAQYEVPRAVDAGSPQIRFSKGVPAGIALEFMAMEDLAAASEAERFGRLIQQHQAPL
jgi:hypothetical protein